MKFKKGDILKCMNNVANPGLDVGTYYIAESDSYLGINGTEYVSLTDDRWHGGMLVSRFKLIDMNKLSKLERLLIKWRIPKKLFY